MATTEACVKASGDHAKHREANDLRRALAPISFPLSRHKHQIVRKRNISLRSEFRASDAADGAYSEQN